jgi:hypothetical protein
MTRKSSLLAILALCGLGTMAQAQVLLLDFGPTAASGASLSNSPYHTVNPGAGTSWNTLGVADSSTLVTPMEQRRRG